MKVILCILLYFFSSFSQTDRQHLIVSAYIDRMYAHVNQSIQDVQQYVQHLSMSLFLTVYRCYFYAPQQRKKSNVMKKKFHYYDSIMIIKRLYIRLIFGRSIGQCNICGLIIITSRLTGPDWLTNGNFRWLVWLVGKLLFYIPRSFIAMTPKLATFVSFFPSYFFPLLLLHSVILVNVLYTFHFESVDGDGKLNVTEASLFIICLCAILQVQRWWSSSNNNNNNNKHMEKCTSSA